MNGSTVDRKGFVEIRVSWGLQKVTLRMVVFVGRVQYCGCWISGAVSSW